MSEVEVSFVVRKGGWRVEGLCPRFGPRPAVGEGETKKASRPAKMIIFIQNPDFSKSIEKPLEKQLFGLPQPAPKRPKMA